MRRRSEESDSGLDSFMDIVTNVIGLMVLIAAAIALNAQKISFSLGAPMLHDPPPGADEIRFECRKDRIVRLRQTEILEDAIVALERRHKRNGYVADAEDNFRWLESQDIGDQYYRIAMGFGDDYRPRAYYHPRKEIQGETTQELKSGSSDFEATIAELKPDDAFVFFVVREDSFAVFRNARAIARKHGLITGWHALKSEYPLNFFIDNAGGGWGGKVQ